jgi:hypothetical protein
MRSFGEPGRRPDTIKSDRPRPATARRHSGDLPAEKHSGAAIRPAARQLSLSARVAREMSLMSAAHSGKFAGTDFTETGFAAAGPEHEPSEGEGD